MRVLKNTSNLKIDSFSFNGNQTKPFPEGAVMTFPIQLYPLADHFLDKFGFIKELNPKDVETKNTGKHICEWCGFEAKAPIGLISHKRYCKKKPKDGEKVKKKKKIAGITPMEYTGKIVTRTTEGVSRGQAENQGFQDMPELSGRPTKKSKIAGKTQDVTVDKDGIEWYGDGVQEDTPLSNIPRRNKQPGKF
jgi:hypothetical protein